MQCCVVSTRVSTCFAKEILRHATLMTFVQPPHLVCGFPCFIGDLRTRNARDARDARTSTTYRQVWGLLRLAPITLWKSSLYTVGCCLSAVSKSHSSFQDTNIRIHTTLY